MSSPNKTIIAWGGVLMEKNITVICDCCRHTAWVDATMPLRCGYCGYRHAFGTKKESLQERAHAYREKVLSNLSISVKFYQYEWNSTEGKYMLLPEDPSDPDMTTPLPAIKLIEPKRLPKYIAHITHDDNTTDPVPIHFEYTYFGQKRSGLVILHPAPVLGKWDLGMAINDKLQLVFYLGPKYSLTLDKGQPVDLNLMAT